MALMDAVEKSVLTNVEDMFSHAKSIIHENVYELNRDFYVGYRWVAALDYKTCLEEGQLVETPAGNKKIEMLCVGDYVIGGSGNKRKIIAKYSKIVNNMIEIVLENGNIIRCTEDHLFLTPEGWIKAGELEGHEIKENL
jgi:hypothetical protein